jgi:hypothetical protein
MNAAQIAATLGDPRRDGRAWRSRCPLCFRRNFTLQDGSAVPLVTCWNGCNRSELVAELRRRGLLDGHADYTPHIVSAPRLHDDARRTARALNIWRDTKRGAGTITARYLASRGITPDQWPTSLRFHSRCPRPKDDAGNFVSPLPAMVGLVEHVEHGPMAVHCTYLRSDGSGKAAIEKPKAIFGPVAGGAVRFAMPRQGQWFAVGEGLETTLSVAAACSMPAWAALSAGGDQKFDPARRGDPRSCLLR